MKPLFLIEEAVQALRSNYLRSSLTVIGIVVGIFSVTAMLALGAGLSQNVLNRFNSFSQGDLTISGAVTRSDLQWITTQPYVKAAVGTISINGASVIAAGEDYSPTVQAVVGNYKALTQYEIVDGTDYDFTDASYNEPVVLVSETFADTVAKDTGVSILNQTIVMNNQGFTVEGIIKANSTTFSRGDGLILVPYGSAVGALTSAYNFSSVAVMLKDSAMYDIAGQDILANLNASRFLAPDSTDLFRLQTAQTFIETAESTVRMISIFLGVVGGIALFVGGIGTMNMMLTTVTERTREIGLRKAVGARNRDIMLQILLESIILTSFGGLVGIALTIILAQIGNSLLSGNNALSILVNYEVVALAAVVAVSVGVVFGLYPARSAAKLQPVDALRSE